MYKMTMAHGLMSSNVFCYYSKLENKKYWIWTILFKNNKVDKASNISAASTTSIPSKYKHDSVSIVQNQSNSNA